MKPKAPVLALLLYAAALTGANPALAETPPELLAELSDMRAGDMRKLNVPETPGPVYDATFQAPDGSDTSLAAERGKIVLVNFWAAWCAPCREEMPALNALQKALGGPDFQVVTVANGPNNPAALAKFLEEEAIDVLPRNTDRRSELGRQAGVLGMPVTLILDRDGHEIGRLTGGADWNAPDARALIERLIAATADPA